MQSKFTWSRNDVGSHKCTSSMRIFQVGSMFSVLPVSLISSTYTDKKRALARLTNENSQLMLNSIVYRSHARHVSTWLIVPASYDEYTALVKSGNVVTKHVWKAVNGAYRWWKPGYRDVLSDVPFLLVMWWHVLCCFSFSTRELV